MSNINDNFDSGEMRRIGIKIFDCPCGTENYRHYQVVDNEGFLYNVYMMHEQICVLTYEEPYDILQILEDSFDLEDRWIITIQMNNEFENLKVCEYMPLSYIEEQLEGQFSCIREFELFRNIIGHLMNSP